MAKQKVFGYTRVSTAEQVEGFGLDVQEAAIRKYCKDEGLLLVAMLTDEGQSGSNGLDDRLGLAEGLARIERGEASALVVYRLDRLARDLLLQETVHARLETAGASVLSVSEPAMTGDDPTRVLVRQLLGGIAQYERAVIRGRMMAGKAAKVAKGGYGGGRPAYGQRADGGELVANTEEAAIVETVTTMRKAGESYRSIATALKDGGLTTRSGGEWNPNQVRRIAQRSGVVPEPLEVVARPLQDLPGFRFRRFG
jgi:DNA invertase Pin-like site-specific DNA recombinase